jgi:hypothetical protein
MTGLRRGKDDNGKKGEDKDKEGERKKTIRKRGNVDKEGGRKITIRKGEDKHKEGKGG